MQGFVDGLVGKKTAELHCLAPNFTLIANGRAESQAHQGVTTEMFGQCSVSCTPACDNAVIQNMAFGFAEGCHPLGWRSFGDNLDTLEEIELGVNVIAFVGHGAVHQAVLGDTLRAENDAEVDVMTRLVKESLDQIFRGFRPVWNTGKGHWPRWNTWCRSAPLPPSAASSTLHMCAIETVTTILDLPKHWRQPACPGHGYRFHTFSPNTAPQPTRWKTRLSLLIWPSDRVSTLPSMSTRPHIHSLSNCY